MPHGSVSAARGIAGARLHRDQVDAVVAVEHPLVEHAVTRQAALKHVAIGPVDAFVVDLGLHDEAVADAIAVARLAPTPTTVSETSWPSTTGSLLISRKMRGGPGPG